MRPHPICTPKYIADVMLPAARLDLVRSAAISPRST
jgi:hypothetical protein